jgi:hypothetical protein
MISTISIAFRGTRKSPSPWPSCLRRADVTIRRYRDVLAELENTAFTLVVLVVLAATRAARGLELRAGYGHPSGKSALAAGNSAGSWPEIRA